MKTGKGIPVWTEPATRRERRALARRVRKQLERELRPQLAGASPRRHRAELTALATLLVFGAGAAEAGAAVTSSVGGSPTRLTIAITGDTGDDVTVACDAGNVEVNGSAPGTGPATCTSLEEIHVTGDGSTNTIDLNENLLFTDFGEVDVTILGGAGNDTIIGGIGSGFVTPGPGNDSVEGSGLYLVESADADMSLSGISFSEDVFDGGPGLGTDTLEFILGASLTGGAGNNTIDATTFGSSTTLDGGSGTDSLVGGTSFDTFTGGLGNDTIRGGLTDEVHETRDSHMQLFDDRLEFGNPTVTETDTYPNPLGSATLTGGAGNNLIQTQPFTSQGSNAGHDTSLEGAGGQDTLNGGGRHVLTGGAGNDLLQTAGPPGDPSSVVAEQVDTNLTLTSTDANTATLVGPATGTDTLNSIAEARLGGGAGNTSIDASGFDWAATLEGGAGSDTLKGAEFSNLFPGEIGGNDSIVGGAGEDTLGDMAINFGGPNYGSFTLTDTSLVGAAAGNDSMSGVEAVGLSGHDTPGNVVDASTFSGVLSYRSGAGDDSIKGANGTINSGFVGDIIWAGTGADTIDGFGGPDRIEGNGPHSMTQDSDPNTIAGGAGFDTLVGDVHLDAFDGNGSGGVASDQNDVEDQGEGTVTITNTAITSTGGNAGVQTMNNIDVVEISGGDGDDSLDASAFDPTNGALNAFFGAGLTGNGGNDTLVGSHGQDTFEGSSGTDRLVASNAPQPNLVFSTVSGQLRFDGDDLLQGGTTELVTGIEQASLTGSAGANVLNAGVVTFPVTLRGGAGNDTLTSGSSHDSLDGEGGVDDYFANAGNEQIMTQDGVAEGVINCGQGSETVTGDANDTLNADCGIELAPVIGGTGSALAYTENDAPTQIAPALTVSDGDSSLLSGATVAITDNFADGEDELGFVNQNGITGSYNDSTGVLTLTGSASVATYQTALRTVTYENTSDDPSTDDREVSFKAKDPGDVETDPPATRTITVTAQNDAPIATTSGGSTANTPGQESVVDGAFSSTDPDGFVYEGATVRISAGFQAGDELLFTNQSDIVGTYNALTGVLTLTGSDGRFTYDDALQSVRFRTTNANPVAAKTVEFVVNDGALNSNAATKALAVGTGGGGGPTPDPTPTPAPAPTPTPTFTPTPTPTPGPAPPDVVAATRPGCFNIPTVVRDRTVLLPGGGKLILSTRQVDDPVNPLRISARVTRGQAQAFAFKVNGRLVIGPGAGARAAVASANATVAGALLKIGSRRNRVDVTATLPGARKVSATQYLVVLRCPLPVVTCKRTASGATCTSRTPLGATRVKASLINPAGRTVAAGSAPVRRGRYTATLRGRVAAGRYQYRHVATTRKRGEKLLMVRVIAIT